MVRVLLVGYCYSIRSERRLCQEVKANLAYRWFCGLGLEDKVPHHSTFSVDPLGRFRESDLLRKVFEEVVCSCMKAGLVGSEGFAVDALVIEADASRFKRVEGSGIDWTERQLQRRAIREFIDALDGGDAPTNPERAPKVLSPTDPATAWTTRGRHKVMFGHSLNYLIDMEAPIILDVEAAPHDLSPGSQKLEPHNAKPPRNRPRRQEDVRSYHMQTPENPSRTNFLNTLGHKQSSSTLS